MGILSLQSKHFLGIFGALATLTTSMLFPSEGFGEYQVQLEKDPAFILLVNETWQSDQMDSEYPTEEQPRSKVNVKDWSMGDHMVASKLYEEEARLLVAEVRAMELIENRLLPYLEIEVMKQVDLPNLIDRHKREAQEKIELASIHHRIGLQLMDNMEKTISATSDDKATKEPTQQSIPYLKFRWMEEQGVMGW